MSRVNWEVDVEDNRILANDKRQTIICHLSASCRNPEMLADARLIAAAPELLEALKELVARCDGDEGVRADGSNIQTIRAHAVIAKLEGERSEQPK